MFAPHQTQIIMKCFLITALFLTIGVSSFAQESKKEATVKIVVIENGKEKVIERKFADISKADAEIQKLSDSLDLKVTKKGNKIVRIDVNKSDRRGGGPQFKGPEGKELNIITEDLRGDFGPNGPGARNRSMIVRRMRKGESPADVIIFNDNDSVNSPKGSRRNFEFQRQGTPPFGNFMGGRKRMWRSMASRRMNGGMGGEKLSFENQMNGSKTIKGLISYPNQPFNGKLNVRFKAPEKGNVSISVSDVNGKEISSEQIKDFSGLYLGQVDLKKSGPGVYFVRVTQSNDGAVRRVKVD
jgi:hypothetical protein